MTLAAFSSAMEADTGANVVVVVVLLLFTGVSVGANVVIEMFMVVGASVVVLFVVGITAVGLLTNKGDSIGVTDAVVFTDTSVGGDVGIEMFTIVGPDDGVPVVLSTVLELGVDEQFPAPQ